MYTFFQKHYSTDLFFYTNQYLDLGYGRLKWVLKSKLITGKYRINLNAKCIKLILSIILFDDLIYFFKLFKTFDYKRKIK